jgi:hypothetical protein
VLLLLLAVVEVVLGARRVVGGGRNFEETEEGPAPVVAFDAYCGEGGKGGFGEAAATEAPSFPARAFTPELGSETAMGLTVGEIADEDAAFGAGEENAPINSFTDPRRTGCAFMCRCWVGKRQRSRWK